ncbi:hypothetical protein GGX14DRAFT_669905 [Mycena pura]|uniref:Uncharacterized protein n=1 Tax=Mycena pura TaxID=153505 RepID=A0AAD6YJ97_9AGAR|nr:hypothetical protein GGX14DRAFT_669905 [Mycena pura]
MAHADCGRSAWGHFLPLCQLLSAVWSGLKCVPPPASLSSELVRPATLRTLTNNPGSNTVAFGKDSPPSPSTLHITACRMAAIRALFPHAQLSRLSLLQRGNTSTAKYLFGILDNNRHQITARHHIQLTWNTCFLAHGNGGAAAYNILTCPSPTSTAHASSRSSPYTLLATARLGPPHTAVHVAYARADPAETHRKGLDRLTSDLQRRLPGFRAKSPDLPKEYPDASDVDMFLLSINEMTNISQV